MALGRGLGRPPMAAVGATMCTAGLGRVRTPRRVDRRGGGLGRPAVHAVLIPRRNGHAIVIRSVLASGGP